MSKTGQKLDICVVEDDDTFRLIFSNLLKPHGHVIALTNHQEAKAYLRTNRPDLMFIDLNLFGSKAGFKIIEEASLKDIHCVVVSSEEDDKTIKECFDLGARDYYIKGEELTLIHDIISKVTTSWSSGLPLSGYISQNEDYQNTLDLLFKNAKSGFPILLYGQTGTGKTFLAKQVHQISEREGKFVAVNCASIPQHLFESEMFGMVEVTPQGKRTSIAGKMREARNGTLYLDEIDSLPISHQLALLKVIEEKSFTPVGSSKSFKASFSIISSSKNDLREKISEGGFRENLYYRISSIEVRTIPLRERREDILKLLRFMLKGPRKYVFKKDAQTLLERHPWPGNIRELRSIAKNIEFSKQSLVTKESLKSILSPEKEGPLLNSSQLALVKDLGAKSFLARIKREIAQHYHSKSPDNARKAIRQIKVSSATFYSWLEERSNES